MSKLYGGRIARMNYFLGSLFVAFSWLLLLIVIITLMHIAAVILGLIDLFATIFLFIYFLLVLVGLFFSFSLAVRRSHDLGQSGWMALLMFVPVANIIYTLCLLFVKGNNNANQFGPTPTKGIGFIDDLLNRKFI